jgi:hypothetical protein
MDDSVVDVTFPVAPWDTYPAFSCRAISICRLAIHGRAMAIDKENRQLLPIIYSCWSHSQI